MTVPLVLGLLTGNVLQWAVGLVGLLFVLGTYPFWEAPTPGSGRTFRYCKWAALVVAFVSIILWAPLGFLAVHPILVHAASEWRRMALRKKLPTDRWPPGLYM